MSGSLAIVGYRCLVAGVPDGTLDVQVRWFAGRVDEDDLRERLRAEPPSEYFNSDGNTVRWELAKIYAVEPLDGTPEDGDEVAGFIAEIDELDRDARAAWPAD